MRRVLLWLWKVLPLTQGMQGPLLWVLNAKFLVGVMAVAFDDAGRVLVVHHTYRNRYPWGLPGGWLGRGEHPSAGALRELLEETGFVGEPLGLIGIWSGPRSELAIGYRVRIVGGSFAANDEIDRHAFVDPLALPDGFLPFQREVVRASLPAPGA